MCPRRGGDWFSVRRRRDITSNKIANAHEIIAGVRYRGWGDKFASEASVHRLPSRNKIFAFVCMGDRSFRFLFARLYME